MFSFTSVIIIYIISSGREEKSILYNHKMAGITLMIVLSWNFVIRGVAAQGGRGIILKLREGSKKGTGEMFVGGILGVCILVVFWNSLFAYYTFLYLFMALKIFSSFLRPALYSFLCYIFDFFLILKKSGRGLRWR